MLSRKIKPRKKTESVCPGGAVGGMAGEGLMEMLTFDEDLEEARGQAVQILGKSR